MRNTLAPVAPLLASVALLIAGCGVLNVLLPIRAEMEAFGTLAIGAMGSAHSLGFVAGCLFGARIVGRVGHIRVFAALVGLASCVFLAHAMVVEPLAWWALRAAAGACFATLFLVIESWLNEKATNATRGAVFCAYAVVSHVCGSMGQVLVAFGEPDRFALFSIGSILVSLAALPVALSRTDAPAPPRAAPRVRIVPLWRASPVGFAGCAAAGFGGGAFWSLAPSFALGATGSTAAVPLLMTAPILAAAVVQWPIGLLSDRVDRRIVIAGAAAAAAAAGLVVFAGARAGGAEAGALAMGFAVLGAAFIPIGALSVANANDFAPEGAAVETAAGLLLVSASGAVAGPITASVAMARFGPEALFLVTSAVFGALALFAAWRRTRRAAPEVDEPSGFLDAVVAIETVASIKPAGFGPAAVAPTPRPSAVPAPIDAGLARAA